MVPSSRVVKSASVGGAEPDEQFVVGGGLEVVYCRDRLAA